MSAAPHPRRPAPRRLRVALGCLVAIAASAGADEIEIEPAARALARLDSLQAIVRAEEARVRPALGVESLWTRLARAWFQVGDHARAAKCLERARAIGAREFETALLTGRIARSEGRFDEAVEWLERAARMRPDDWEAREDLGLALYLAGRLGGAADQWTRARALPGSGSPDRGSLIEAMRRAGDRAYRVAGRGRERIAFEPPAERGPYAIRLRVNGRGPYLFRVDAGSPEITLAASVAAELGIEAIAPGTTGAPATAHAVADSVTLGATTVARLPVAIRPFPEGAQIAGVLGFEVLRRFRFCIDPAERALWLDPLRPTTAPPDTAGPGWSPAGAVVHRVPILLRGTHLMIAYGRVDRGPERPFLIEAGGSGVALAAPASTIAEAGITLDPAQVRSGTSAGGRVRYLGFPIARLCVAGACRDSLEGGYGTFPPRLELNPSFRLAGIVSGGFLQHYRVAVDLARAEVSLVER